MKYKFDIHNLSSIQKQDIYIFVVLWKQITIEWSKLNSNILSSADPDIPPLHEPSMHTLRTAQEHMTVIMPRSKTIKWSWALGSLTAMSHTWLRMVLDRSQRNPRISYIPPEHGTILITATCKRTETTTIHKFNLDFGKPNVFFKSQIYKPMQRYLASMPIT